MALAQRARMFSKMPGILRGKKRALVMIKPPSQLRRVRVLEVHNDVLIAVEYAALPGMRCAVRHAAEMKFGGRVEAFAIKAVEERGGGSAIKAAIVKTEPYAGHVEPECAFLSLGVDFSRDKALNNASRSFGSQVEIRARQMQKRDFFRFCPRTRNESIGKYSARIARNA